MTEVRRDRAEPVRVERQVRGAHGGREALEDLCRRRLAVGSRVDEGHAVIAPEPQRVDRVSP